jgi:hypothetical protein
MVREDLWFSEIDGGLSPALWPTVDLQDALDPGEQVTTGRLVFQSQATRN